MKKYILLLLIFTGTRIFAQVPDDAIRYSWYSHNGSARYMAIGGVMGSLGGDITASFVNPAGLGFYRTEEIVFTPGVLLNRTKSNYRETLAKDKGNAFNLGAMGWISGYTSKYNPKASNAFSIALNQTANFNNVLHYKALNNYSSFSEQFAEEFSKSGLSIDAVLNTNSQLPYTAAPALYTYLIDTVRVGNQLMVRGAPENILDAGEALQQEMYKRTRGGMYELAFAYGHNDNDRWFTGITLGIPINYYHSNTTLTESDTSSDISNRFNSATFTDDFKTMGIGLNLKLGAIYRPKEYIRLGLALHTPSFMFQTDTRNSSIVHNDDDTTWTSSSQTFTNDQPGKNSYIQLTPWKAILSASYVFREVENVKRQKGFISADIEYVNHRGSRFSVDKDVKGDVAIDEKKTYYKQLNKVLKDYYKGAFNFRVGGELKFNIIMARLGFAYYMSPYKDKTLKANKMLLSGGLGYRNKGFFVDLTYVHNMSKDVNFPYRLEDRANTFASVKQTQGNISATIGFKL
jgi:hypothetical protein